MRRVQMTVGLVAVIVVCTLAFVGCRGTTGRSLGQQIDDKLISSQVKAKLTTDRALNLISTGVGTQFGVVRLTGTVQTPDQKTEAERIALRVAGVRGVNNEILVVPKDQRTAKAAEPATAASGSTPTTVTTAPPSTPPAASSAPTTSTAPTSTIPAASPVTARPLALSGQVTAVNITSGDVTVKTDAGNDIIVRFPSTTAMQLEQGQRISINAATK